MSDIISNRDEFIELFNTRKLYSFSKLSDEIIREFFPLLPIEDYLCNGNISKEIIEEFRHQIEFIVGGKRNLENLLIIENTLRSRVNLKTCFEIRGNKNSVSYRFNIKKFEFEFCVTPSTYLILRKPTNFIIVTRNITNKSIITQINKVLFEYSDKI